MESPAKNTPNEKSELDDVPQAAIDVFVEALASMTQLTGTQLVGVFRRMAGEEYAEIGKELGITAAGAAAAISGAIAKVPVLGAAIRIRTQKQSKLAGKAESPKKYDAAESGKKHPAWARVLAMQESGELAGKVSTWLAGKPLAKARMMEAVAGMLSVPKSEGVVESAIRLIVENGLCVQMTDGRGIFFCTFIQARELKRGGKKQIGPDVKGDTYPDGRPVPVVFREGAASVADSGALDAEAFGKLREKLYAVRAWMDSDWWSVDGFPGLECALFRGRGGAVWAFRRKGRHGAVVTWRNDGESARDSVVDRRLRVWRMRSNPGVMLRLAKTKMRGKFD